MYIDYFIVIVSLLFSAFFEGMEIAYVSSNKISIEIEKKNNNISSKILSKLTSSQKVLLKPIVESLLKKQNYKGDTNESRHIGI